MIACGWMNDFKGSDTLLFVCDRPGIEALIELCRSLVRVPGAQHVREFPNTADHVVRPNQQIRLIGANEPGSRVTVREEHGMVNVDWVVSPSSVPRIIDALSALSASP
jgi:hypothetical protein